MAWSALNRVRTAHGAGYRERKRNQWDSRVLGLNNWANEIVVTDKGRQMRKFSGGDQ